jgi:WD40 repeat protein
MTIGDTAIASGSQLTDLRFLASDSRGSLLELRMPTASTSAPSNLPELAKADSDPESKKEQRSRVLYEARGAGVSKGDFFVQKLARGVLQGTSVVALARKDGRIDVCRVEDGHKLLTLRHDKMKKGIHRWVGLAISKEGVFACTSAGHFRFFRIGRQADDHVASLEGEDFSVDLPEPLQQLTFQPQIDPTHFAYGGEEIPLSVWDISQIINKSAPDSAGSGNGKEQHGSNGADSSVADEAGNEDDQGMNSKARKRKRAAENRAKARELLQGEIWRAKNLPNDSLSLPQRPEINSIAFVGRSSHILAVGTRMGLVRMFNTQTRRTHTTEYRIFSSDKSSVKGLMSDRNGQHLIANNTSGKLFIIDVDSGAIVNQYKGVNGVITSVDTVQSSAKTGNVSFLATASADRLARLHVLSRRKDMRIERKDETLASLFVPDGVSSITWDGESPLSAPEASQMSEGMRDVDDEQTMDDDREEQVWEAMATTVSTAIEEGDTIESDKQNGRSKRRR